MTCDDYLILIYEQVDGEISTANRAVLDGHLKECSACARTYASVCRADTLFKELLPVVEYDKDYVSKLYEESLRPQTNWRRLAVATVTGWLAASVAFMATGFTLPHFPVDTVSEQLWATIQTTHRTLQSLNAAALPEVDSAVVILVVLVQLAGSYALTRRESV